MLWESLLKENQPDILIPPGFTQAKILGNNKCMYSITLKRPLSSWSFVNSKGIKTGNASLNQIYSEIKKYTTIHCCFLQVDPTDASCWIVCTSQHVLKMRFVPDSVEHPAPLTTIIGKGLGGVIAFHSFNMRDMQPWNVPKALEILHLETTNERLELSWLRDDQKLAFSILLDAELKNRIPVSERKIKQIMEAENANLISMKESKGGYSLSFRYKGKIRNVQINEDLTLRDAGMCLDGHDREYSLDSFIAVLQYEDRRSEFLPGRHYDEDEDDDW